MSMVATPDSLFASASFIHHRAHGLAEIMAEIHVQS